MSDSKLNLVLSEANASQARETLNATHGAWGAQLSKEQYVTREETLRTTKFSQERLKTWVLTERSAPNVILSSCETYAHPCVLNTGAGGQLTHGTCLAVASVYTPAEHRRKGYAGIMMHQLRDHLGDAVATTLYSDIGREFYARIGWNVFPSISGIIHVKEPEPIGEDIGMITADNLSAFVQQATKHIQEQVESRKTASFAVLFNEDKIAWYQARTNAYVKLLHLTIPLATLTTLGSYNLEGDQFVLWYSDVAEKRLYILHAHNPGKQDMSGVLAAAVQHASLCGLTKVVIWDPQNNGCADVEAVQIEDRESSLSSASILKAGFPVDIEWVANEKYAWV
ncbi:hypothetical protein DFJ77DRAFT_440495 [Powellomyces hirtus]|nr:hypothetical protein DFJ77DRAFT_440495 [Powellomyces hirtus]